MSNDLTVFCPVCKCGGVDNPSNIKQGIVTCWKCSSTFTYDLLMEHHFQQMHRGYSQKSWIENNMDFKSKFSEEFFEYLAQKFFNGDIPFLYARQTHPTSMSPFIPRFLTVRQRDTGIVYSECVNDQDAYEKVISFLLSEYNKEKYKDGTFIHLLNVYPCENGGFQIAPGNIQAAFQMYFYSSNFRYEVGKSDRVIE